VYSVSLDNQMDKWLRAIKKDELNWYHVSDLKGWKSQGATPYGVRSIPATYLIDPQGKIIAKNLRGAKLTEFLEQTLNRGLLEE
ncbi:MAG: thioredoxin-like domain-containing protein, partial [Cyclobacteriaceae bacterium]|nr:thioredoxin-like domain-containing protein [Cyclobacteriaceae bacterium]